MPTPQLLDHAPRWSADLLFSAPITLSSLRTRLSIQRRGRVTSEKLSVASMSFRFLPRNERKFTRTMRESSSGSGSFDARDLASDGASILRLGRCSGHDGR